MEHHLISVCDLTLMTHGCHSCTPCPVFTQVWPFSRRSLYSIHAVQLHYAPPLPCERILGTVVKVSCTLPRWDAFFTAMVVLRVPCAWLSFFYAGNGANKLIFHHWVVPLYQEEKVNIKVGVKKKGVTLSIPGSYYQNQKKPNARVKTTIRSQLQQQYSGLIGYFEKPQLTQAGAYQLLARMIQSYTYGNTFFLKFTIQSL